MGLQWDSEKCEKQKNMVAYSNMEYLGVKGG